jgi:hypothetical protein
VADRLLGRADALQSRGQDLDFMANLAKSYSLTASHSVSRFTLEQTFTVETKRTPELT